MPRLFSQLIDFMEAEKWRYEILEGENALRFHVKVRAGRLTCWAEALEDQRWVLFYSYLPVNAPEHKLAAVAEFLTRANRGMRIGNFELDFGDGEVRYKTSVDVEGGELSHKMIDNLLQANLSTMDRYYNGIMSVIYSEREPLELIEEIEGVRSARGRAGDAAGSDDDDPDLDDILDRGSLPFRRDEDAEDDDEDDSDLEEFGGYTVDSDDDDDDDDGDDVRKN